MGYTYCQSHVIQTSCGIDVILWPLEATLAYIIDELDEREREDFFRLKKVQSKKKIAKDKEEAMLAERKALLQIDDTDAANILEDDHDEDLLFT